jgi:hypothetical protein
MAEVFLKRWGVDTAADTLESGSSAHADDEVWKGLERLVHERRQIYDKALLQDIGHGHPRFKASHTLDEAKEAVVEIDRRIADYLKGK